MTVLRSRTILPKNSKSPSSSTIEPSTPIKANEHPNPLISSPLSSNLSSSSDPNPSPLGLGLSSSSQTVRRRSLRLASKSNGHYSLINREEENGVDPKKGKEPDFSNADDKVDGSDLGSGDSEKKNKNKRKKPISRALESPSRKAMGLDHSGGDDGRRNSGSDSGNAKRMKNKRECISRVSASVVEKDMGSNSIENEANEGIENRISEVDGLCSAEEKAAICGYSKEKVLEDSSDGDQLVKDGEKEECQETMMGFDEVASVSRSRCSTRGSERLVRKHKMESGADLMLDLNSIPEDGKELKSYEEFVKGKIGSGISFMLLLKSSSVDEDVKELLNLRSGTKISRRRIEVVDVNSDGAEEDKGEVGLIGESAEDFASVELETNHSVIDVGTSVHGEKTYNKEKKGKVQSVKDDCLSIGIDAKKSSAECRLNDLNGITRSKKRYSQEVKGKSVENSQPSISDDLEKLGAGTNDVEQEQIRETALRLMELSETFDLNIAKEEAKQNALRRRDGLRRIKERDLSVAKRYASKVAHVEPNEEDDHSLPLLETEIPMVEAVPEDEDWPGPFSTAMRIIEERAAKLSARRRSSTSDPSKAAPVIDWVPSQDHDSKNLRPLAPSLQDLCFSVLCKNAEAITSLEGIPDALRSKLSHWLCDSRKMDHHVLGLIVSGSPSEICVKDCSWLTEEHFKEILGGCNTEHLRVLELNLCGRCMPDYILRDTLARSPNSLSALDTISLKGAYRLSDDGLNALVSSAPSLRSINLGHCSLLTCTGINILAENLGSVLKELYMDDCQNIDAMLILPALKKFKHLEVLSIAGNQNVCDKFISELIPACGPL